MILDIKNITQEVKRKVRRYLEEALRKSISKATTFEELVERGGLLKIFKSTLPAPIAADFCAIIKRLGSYNFYGYTTWRRPYRSNIPSDYFEVIMSLIKTVVPLSRDSFDLISCLKQGWQTYWAKDYDMAFHPSYGFCMLIANKIDQQDQEVIDTVTEILLSETNTTAITRELLISIAMCHNPELHELVQKLLLAAKLQEGLRQAILESADDGTIKYLLLMMKTVAEHDLLRFSSAMRAVGVWMGMGYDYSDKRIVEKLLHRTTIYLEDQQARDAAIHSKDVTEMYAAMWAVSTISIQHLQAYIEQLFQVDKYQKLVAAYFLMATGQAEYGISLGGAWLHERDLDVLTMLSQSYSLYFNEITGNKWGLAGQTEMQKPLTVLHNHYPSCLKDKAVREAHFWQFAEIIKTIPKGGHKVVGKPFEWSNFSLERERIYSIMTVLAIYDYDPDMKACLIELFPLAGQQEKNLFLTHFICKDYFTNGNISAQDRAFLLECLKDKTIGTRIHAARILTKFTLSEDEIIQLEDNLGLKTAEIRALTLAAINKSNSALVSAKRLLADKNQNKRLAGLDLLTTAKKENKISQKDINQYLTLMPKTSEAETIMINALQEKTGAYTIENGFGLYDPSYFPTLPPIERNPNYTLKALRDVSAKDMHKLMDSLIALIDKHKNHTYKPQHVYLKDEGVLGSAHYLPWVSDADTSKSLTIKDFVLSHVWQEWYNQNSDSLMVMLKIWLYHMCKDYRGNYSTTKDRYNDFATKILTKHFGTDEIQTFAKGITKTSYVNLATSIIDTQLRYVADNAKLHELKLGLLSDLFLAIPEDDWQKPCFKQHIVSQINAYYSNTSSTKLANMDEIKALKPDNAPDSQQYAKELALRFRIGQASGDRYIYLTVEEVARGTMLGILQPQELKRAFMHITHNYHSFLKHYTGPITGRGKEAVEKYPVIMQYMPEVVNRIIEIETKRGDTPTPVSQQATHIGRHTGASNFAEILVALGKETLTRGYGNYAINTKRDTLSSLLKASAPAPEDNAETLSAALNGRINEKRLLEAVMYAPAWIAIAEDYLSWPGLKSAAWYFHAHTRESYSEEFETEVARFSPIDKEDFSRGAFDINWFNEAYTALGAERFAILYDCAKYISSGATHRRAQLFADAALGKLDAAVLEPQIQDKRNKDLLMAYSLIPFGSNTEQALHRYEFIHSFLKESRKFGAQRQTAEKQAANVALENLARNLGYTDAQRFSWKMEMAKLEQVKAYFQPYAIDDTEVFLEWGDNGTVETIISKGGKRLKSIPKALKGDPYVKELTATRAALKSQFTRAKASLQKAMENRDSFHKSEVLELLHHPVIGPLLEKLVFRSGDILGFIHTEGLQDTTGQLQPVDNDAELLIAHAHDLFILGQWPAYQRYAFDQNLVQPFKQIFRELYTVNEDEQATKDISRRYAGHQIQPKKAAALLRARSWTADYYEGLQKVHYKENIVVTMQALADWFSPSEIEAPTIEAVRFFHRKTSKPIALSEICPVLFSEIMRDIDLVVSIAHVGGVDPIASHSTIEMREVIVAESTRLLKLANTQIDGNFIRIQGAYGEYLVHLGSGNVQMMGRGDLNIILVHSQHRGRVFLPFMDEDPKTAEIVSKVLLLSEDLKIKDPSIVSQIKG